MSAILAYRPVIRFAPRLYDVLMGSVGRLEPEHYAILAGRLDDPLRVTDIRPMPPAIDEHGRARASSSTVTLNGPLIEYYLNTELLPFGKYLLGAIHSHPGQHTMLSGGAAGSGQGDIPTMREHLQNAVGMRKPWREFLAPIVTQPGTNPTVTGWIVRLDHDRPIPAEIVWETAPTAISPPTPISSEDLEGTANQLLGILNRCQGHINDINSDRKSRSQDREWAMNAFRRLRDREVEAFERRHLELLRRSC